MAWFSKLTHGAVELTHDDAAPEPATRLVGVDPAKTRESIQRGLMSSLDRLAVLEAEEARIQSEAANTRLAIAALQAAEHVMAEGHSGIAGEDAFPSVKLTDADLAEADGAATP